MTKMDYLKLLVDEIHSTTVATIGSDWHPQTRIIDMMYYDEESVYFLTAKGKAFYDQLMEQQYVAISATKDKIAVILRGKIKNIGEKNLDIMFKKKSVYEENLSGRYERRNRGVSTVWGTGRVFWYQQSVKYCEGYNNNRKSRSCSDEIFCWERLYRM